MLNGIMQRRIALVGAALLMGCSGEFEPDDLLGEDDGVADPGDAEETDELGEGDGDGDGNSSEPPSDGDGDGDGDGGGDGDDDEPEPDAGDGDGDAHEPEDDPSDWPDKLYCDPVAVWDHGWTARAVEVIGYINEVRTSGADCGDQGKFPATKALVWDPALTCAARVHSKEMADYNFFSHKNLQGKDTDWRLKMAGYPGEIWAENIAASYFDPLVVFENWLASDAHCANLFNPNFVAIGVAYAFHPSSTFAHYWTLDLGG